MKNFKLRTRYRNIEVVKYSDIAQVVLSSSVCGQLNLEVFNLSSTHYEKLVSYTSLPLLLAYAKRNQIPASICLADDHQDIRQCSNCEHDDQCAKQLAYLATDTFCPCPPEASPLDEVGGGISARHMLLSETVSGGLSVTGDFLLSDLDELLKDYPVNGCAQPRGLE